MKKNDWLLTAGILSYSYLLYEQFAGINFLVFTVVLITILGIRDRFFLLHKKVWFPLAGALISAVCITIYGKGLAVFANICSLGLLSVWALNRETSLLTSLFHSVYSYVSAPVFMFADLAKRLEEKGKENSATDMGKILFYVVPAAVSLLFFFLYRDSSSLFRNLTDRLQFELISAKWVFFTLGGTVLLYGFFYNHRIKALLRVESRQKDHITRSGSGIFRIFGQEVNLTTEQRSGILMLVLLNFLILIVNILDINFLFLGSVLPEGMTYSELVHQGIGSLIFSIMTAIAIILWYFRAEQNFASDNTLKLLTFIWIAQNVVMIAANVHKNTLYIEESSLTYKRIGVYVYLVLALTGLILTALKIRNTKSNWYLLKTNAVAAYVVLLLSCMVNWDYLIVKFNISQAEKKNKNPDVSYLGSLSDSVIPDLYKWIVEHPDSSDLYLKPKLDLRMLTIWSEDKLVDWRSWSIERKRVSDAIGDFFEQGATGRLTMDEPAIVPHPDKLQNISVKKEYGEKLTMPELQPFINIEELDLSRNMLYSIQGIPSFKKIRRLDLSSNVITVLNPVTRLTTLEELNVSSNAITALPEMNVLIHLKKIDLSGNNIDNIDALSALENLEEINLNNTQVTDFTPLLKLAHLKVLIAPYHLNYGDTQKLRSQFAHVKLSFISPSYNQ